MRPSEPKRSGVHGSRGTPFRMRRVLPRGFIVAAPALWRRSGPANGIRFLACALVLTVSVSAAGAARFRDWSKPQKVVPRVDKTGAPVIGADASGGEVVAWSGYFDHYHFEGQLLRPQVAIRAPGAARFGPSTDLSKTRGANLQLAVAANGAAIALWETLHGFEYAVRPRGQAFGAPVAVERHFHLTGLPGLGIADDGSALMSWADYDGSAPLGPSRAIYRDGMGKFQPVPGFDGDGLLSVGSDIDRRGDMVVAYQNPNGATALITRTAGGSFSPPRVVLHKNNFTDNVMLTEAGEIILRSDRGGKFAVCSMHGDCATSSPPFPYWQAVATNRTGRTFVAWATKPTRKKTRTIKLATRLPGGKFSERTIATGIKTNRVDDLEVDDHGDLVVGWTPSTIRNALMTRSFAPRCGWSPILRATPNYHATLRRNFESFAADLTLTQSGRATAAWAKDSSGNSRGLFVSDLPSCFGR